MRQARRLCAVALTLALSLGSSVFADDPAFVAIDYPGADSTQLWGINARGDIVGVEVRAGVTHGFLKHGQTFTEIDYPGADATEAFGINARGDIVGDYTVAGVTRAYLLNEEGFTQIDVPGATLTSPGAINARGDIVGLYASGGATHGFLLSRGELTSIDVPGATTTLALGINAHDDIVGGYRSAGVGHAFVLLDGVLTSFDFPGATFTAAFGITPGRDIVGRYVDAGNVSHGYLLSNGQFNSIDFPGGVFSDATAVNPKGDIVGRYRGTDNVFHGYLLTREERLEDRYTLTDLGTLGGTTSIAFGINERGHVGGVATDPSELQHAVLWRGRHLIDAGQAGLNSQAGGPNAKDELPVITEVLDSDPLNENFCQFGTGLRCVGAVWKEGATTLLPTLGGNNAAAININRHGQVIGFAETSTADSTCGAPQQLQFQAVMWTKKGEPVTLPPLPGDTVGFALGINDRGQVVGASGTCSNTPLFPFPIGPHAVLWQNGSPFDLTGLGGTLNTAAAVNNRGEVVGGSSVAGETAFHTFLWTRKRGIEDLGAVEADNSSYPTAINSDGRVVGASCDQTLTACRAYLWTRSEGMADLNSLVVGSRPLNLIVGNGINDAGEIVGLGVDSSGQTHAFLAKPMQARRSDHEKR
jgi:probable HAF family extracellular repeat protein